MKKTLIIAVCLSMLGVASIALAKGFVVVCHKPGGKHGGLTLLLPERAAERHFGHGDTVGACRNNPSPSS